MTVRKPTNPRVPSARAPGAPPDRKAVDDSRDRTAELLRKVRVLLDAGQPELAFNYLKPATSDPALKNARGVCLLRMGQPASALLVYRDLCLMPGGISLRADVPTSWKTNFATTLLMQDNISGARSILQEIHDPGHSEVRKLRAAIQKWKGGLSFWQRLQWALGHQPQRPFALESPPGALE